MEADARANGYKYGILKHLNYTRKYLRCLRKVEYVNNCKSNSSLLLGGGKLHRLYLSHKLYRLGLKTGFTIPPNTFGKGLYLPHHGLIVVNGSARFGDNCIVQCGVNVSEGVVGGNHLYLGAGCKLLIGVNIGNDVIVGANAVVTKSFDEDNIVLAGMPAKKISDKGFRNRKKV